MHLRAAIETSLTFKYLVMKTRLLFLLGLTFAIVVSCKTKPEPQGTITQTNQQTMYDFNAKWKVIDSLQYLGQFRSALVETEKLIDAARLQEAYPHLVQGLLYKARFISQIEENGPTKAIAFIEEEASRAPFPVKPLLLSYLAESYYDYLQSNLWKFQDRTATSATASEDIDTWTLPQFESRIRGLYWASIADERLKSLPTGQFELLLQDTMNVQLRPTLYDLLVHRALDHFSNPASWLTQPSYQFEIDQPIALASIDEFLTWRPLTPDTASWHLQVVRLYQQLLDFRRANSDSNPAALLDADLKRLEFVRSNAIFENKDQLYLQRLEEWRQHFEGNPLEAEVLAALAEYYWSTGSQYDPLREKMTGNPEPTKWHFKTAVELCKKAMEKYPNTHGATNCKGISTYITIPRLQLQTEEYPLPGKPAAVALSYANTQEVFLKVIRMNDARFEQWRSLDVGRKALQRKLQWLDTQPAVSTKRFQLPDDGDFRMHAVELYLDGLEPGRYLLVVSDRQNLEDENATVGFTTFQTSRLGVFHQMDHQGVHTFIVHDKELGAPLEGVEVQFFEERYDSRTRQIHYNLLESQKTASNGQVHFGRRQKSLRFNTLFIHGNDSLELDQDFTSHYWDSEPEPYDQTILLLDRGIYRPGQTVWFKAYALHYDQKRLPSPKIGVPINITLRNANYDEVATVELQTNEFGTAHGHFVLPTTGLAGQYSLVSSIGGSTAWFRVEDYKRPRFEVKIDSPEKDPVLGDTVKVTGLASAYAGYPLDGAQVRWRVVREVRFPWLPWWYSRWFPHHGASRELAHGLSTTDAQGRFQVVFPAMPDRSSNSNLRPEFHFTIYADVTDANGETQSGSKTVVVGYQALRLDAALGDENTSSQLDSVRLIAENLDGNPLRTKGRFSLQSLQRPEQVFIERLWERPDRQVLSDADFKRLFPHLPYGFEDMPDRWAIEKTLAEGSFDTGISDALFLRKFGVGPGWYLLTLKASDSRGNEVITRKYFMVWDENARQVPLTKPHWTHVPKNALEPGEKLHVHLAAPGKGHALIQLLRSNEVLRQEWFSFEKWASWSHTIAEADRGNLEVRIMQTALGRSSITSQTIVVPWSNKELKIELQTFRDKLLPGQQEEWRFRIKGPNGEAAAAEILASMYDASLDAFVSNNWQWNIWPRNYAGRPTKVLGIDQSFASWLKNYRGPYYDVGEQRVPKLKSLSIPAYSGEMMLREKVMLSASFSEEAAIAADGALPPSPESMTEQKPAPPPPPSPTTPQLRGNLEETVFFKPELRTDEQGNLILSFTMKEALTRWKFQMLAHTRALEVALLTKEVITQKDFMVIPNPPRFFREGNEIEYTAKVVNLTDKPLRGTAQLQLVNPLTSMPVYKWLDNPQFTLEFQVEASASTQLAWRFVVPDVAENPVIENTVMAWAGDQSDGERHTTPVLPNRMLVTETLPLAIRGQQSKEYVFERLRQANSPTLSHYGLTLEFSSNPAWYAVQALPYLMEYPHECSEQIFSRFYANSLAAAVANSTPRIKAIFDRWRASGTEAMQSNLSKNEELKSALLEETPWVLDASSEEEQKRRIALLFDLHRLADEATVALQKLQQNQLPGGGWPWFSGGRDDWYITQYIVEGFGRLRRLGVGDYVTDPAWQEMIRSAVSYCDARMLDEYEKLEKAVEAGKTTWEADHLGYLAAHYLYARSFFLETPAGAATGGNPIPNDAIVPLEGKSKQVHSFYLSQAEKYWMQKGLYTQGMLTMALSRQGRQAVAQTIVKSLEERAIRNEELGMYWNYPSGWWWYQAPVETHSLLIEVFKEVARDEQVVQELRIWLLKNKQTNHWQTTRATANAIYALLMDNAAWLHGDQPVKITLGDDPLLERRIASAQQQAEAGTGYFKFHLSADEVGPELAHITLDNPNPGIAWGGIYWQYFENLDKITGFRDTPLKMEKTLSKVTHTDAGEVLVPIADQPLAVGDIVAVRIVLKVDRDMEYVHMKDMRASALEPVDVLSTYRWQGGLGYYQSTRDAASHFFFSYLPKGTYVFEYRLKVTNRGNFSNGISTIQCMYAPEFSSHSAGGRIVVR